MAALVLAKSVALLNMVKKVILFTGGCALVLIGSGVWHGRGAKKQNADSE
jgi:hypothetical protein